MCIRDRYNDVKSIPDAAGAAADVARAVAVSRAADAAAADTAAIADFLPVRNAYYDSTVKFATELLNLEKTYIDTAKEAEATENMNRLGGIYNQTLDTFNRIKKLGENITRTPEHTQMINNNQTTHNEGFKQARTATAIKAAATKGSNDNPIILTDNTTIYFKFGDNPAFSITVPASTTE